MDEDCLSHGSWRLSASNNRLPKNTGHYDRCSEISTANNRYPRLVFLFRKRPAGHIEPTLRLVIVLTSQNIFGVTNSIFEFDVDTFVSGKLLGNVEWLSKETLQASGATDDLFLIV